MKLFYECVFEYERHPANKECKFIDFRDDGFEVRAHIGLVEGDSAKDKKQHLLDVWNGRIEAPSRFCVESTVTAEDEWLHSFYYFNDEIPTEEDFEKAIGDYLSFEFSMVMQNREYLFKENNEMEDYMKEMMSKKFSQYKTYAPKAFEECMIDFRSKKWEPFPVPDIFEEIQRGKRLKNADHIAGIVPYVSSTAMNNGVDDFIVASKGTRVFSNCISLANSGSVGSAFYEPFRFVASDHITHLSLKNANMYMYLFLISVLEKQKSNFNFNREINDQRIKRMRIMLPVDGDGNPDYAFMEQYGKMLVAKKYKQYLDYLDCRKSI